ncbi:aminotransferase class-V [Legionella sainthelensi]|uniref:aminotransferase class V-fold PLP-dependent enzyme n=1 Tax=Legionella sainthelensi TaxID=28087 RepID=UPI000F6E987B|nr:aminotransferase class V-fold PLP-dependent enzyme [Legionella sainthelensi]VEB36458.1 aminotransferase class-V [Legionella sainthelensi]
MKISEVRQLFPGLKDKVFLDAACVSLLPVSSKLAIDNFLDIALHCYAEDASAHHIQMDRMRLEALDEAAKLLQVNVNNLALIESTTFGLNTAANALNLRHGDNVLIADSEFLQVSIPWIKKQQKIGIEIKPVYTQDGKLTINEFEKRIDKNTKAICVSSVQWCTGYRIDLEALGKLCQQNNIWLIVDGIHELGAMEVNLQKHYVDFYIAGGHKWLNSPLGCGIMYLSDRVLNELSPNSFGYLSLEEPQGGWGTYFRTPSITPFQPFNFSKTAKQFEVGGTSNYIGAIGLGKSISLINQLGIQSIESRIRELSNLLHQELNKLNVCKITQEDEVSQSGITVFSFYNNAEKDLALLKALLERKIYLSMRYTSNLGGLRVSTHFFNNEEDIQKLIHSIRTITN